MNMFKPTDAKSPEEYLDMIDEPRRSEMKQLHDLILRIAPDLKPHIIYGMIGYGSFHYKSPSGREGDWSLVALASQKNYILLYLSCVDEKGYIAEQSKSLLPKANIGRSCIRFKRLSDIDLGNLEAVIRRGLAAKPLGG
jgi:hypothetical protein